MLKKTPISKQSLVSQGKISFNFDMCLMSRSFVSRLVPLIFGLNHSFKWRPHVPKTRGF